MSNVNLNLYRIFCKVDQSKSYSEASENLVLILRKKWQKIKMTWRVDV